MITFKHSRQRLSYRLISSILTVLFAVNTIAPVRSYAQSIPLNLPIPGTMLQTTAAFNPAVIMGINIHPEDPLKFDFIIEKGDANLEGEAFNDESNKLIKYFLAALTTPQEQMWVNLSPYERGRIIPDVFGRTEMGRDMLAQDYILKQLSASMLSPEQALGKEFWARFQTKAKAQFGSSDIPMDVFNKIWIVPQTASIYEHSKGAYIVNSHLKVMLEQDYLAMEVNRNSNQHGLGDVKANDLDQMQGVSAQIIRDVLLPEIEKEVNEGKLFAPLRQMYHSMLLAKWYKDNLKQSLLGQVYADKGKTDGVNSDPKVNQQIYDAYLKAFEKGAYDYIKEDYDPITQQIIPKKYFSGGATFVEAKTEKASQAMMSRIQSAARAGLIALVTIAALPNGAIAQTPAPATQQTGQFIPQYSDWMIIDGKAIRFMYFNNHWYQMPGVIDENGKPGRSRIPSTPALQVEDADVPQSVKQAVLAPKNVPSTIPATQPAGKSISFKDGFILKQGEIYIYEANLGNGISKIKVKVKEIEHVRSVKLGNENRDIYRIVFEEVNAPGNIIETEEIIQQDHPKNLTKDNAQLADRAMTVDLLEEQAVNDIAQQLMETTTGLKVHYSQVIQAILTQNQSPEGLLLVQGKEELDQLKQNVGIALDRIENQAQLTITSEPGIGFGDVKERKETLNSLSAQLEKSKGDLKKYADKYRVSDSAMLAFLQSPQKRADKARYKEIARATQADFENAKQISEDRMQVLFASAYQEQFNKQAINQSIADYRFYINLFQQEIDKVQKDKQLPQKIKDRLMVEPQKQIDEMNQKINELSAQLNKLAQQEESRRAQAEQQRSEDRKLLNNVMIPGIQKRLEINRRYLAQYESQELDTRALHDEIDRDEYSLKEMNGDDAMTAEILAATMPESIFLTPSISPWFLATATAIMAYTILTLPKEEKTDATTKRIPPTLRRIIQIDLTLEENALSDGSIEAIRTFPMEKIIANGNLPTEIILNAIQGTLDQNKASFTTSDIVNMLPLTDQGSRITEDWIEAILSTNAILQKYNLKKDGNVWTRNVGGIDFNPDIVNMDVRKEGAGLHMPVPSVEQLDQFMNVNGFVPVIINVTPVTNLPLLLGMTESATQISQLN